jgi:hypothetical protein
LGGGVNAGMNAAREQRRADEAHPSTGRQDSAIFERDTGFEPATFSLGS